MSSDRARLAAPLLLAVLGLAGCGKQGDPRPKPRIVPQPATDLALRLRGDRVLLDFRYPNATVAGLPLPGIESATIFELVRELPPGAPPPALVAADFDALARPVVTLAGPELAAAVAGDRVRAALVLPPEAFAASQLRAYAVRTRAETGDPSPWSNLVSLQPVTAPAAPWNVLATPRADGITIAWSRVDGAVGYSVLRRVATDPEWGPPLATLSGEVFEFVDRAALYGTRYVYTVVSLAASAPPVESLPRAEREVAYTDVFSPPTPAGLRAVPLTREVRLLWESSSAPDLAGYHVERAPAGGEFARLTAAPLAAPEYSDRGAPSGAAVRYRVLAVDRLGNLSPPTPEVEVRAP